jgi:uncharacterized membrane protein YeaQ/YmgE (transglycosylase-associated protein family)
MPCRRFFSPDIARHSLWTRATERGSYVNARVDTTWFVVGMIASKIINNSGEGTVVDALIGIVGAVVGGWLFNLFGGTGITGVNVDSAFSAAVGLSALRNLPQPFAAAYALT